MGQNGKYSRLLFILVFSFSLTFMLLLVLSFPYLEPGSETHAIAQINVIILSALVLSSGLLLYLNWTPF